MIDLKNRVGFVHVPKCAGASIEDFDSCRSCAASISGITRLKDLDSHMRPQWTYLEGKAKGNAFVRKFYAKDFARYHPQLPAVCVPQGTRRPELRPRSADAAD